MRGDDDILDLLNEVLTAELTAVNQYFADAKMYANWGYDRLAEKFREESIGEMRDADELIERILEGEEDHADWLETQLDLVGQVGEPFYLAQQIHG